MVVRHDALEPGRPVRGGQVFPSLRRSLDDRLEALRALEVGWDGYHAPPPVERALIIAQEALDELEAHGVAVRVAADVEGGVSLTVAGVRPAVFAWIHVDNHDTPGLLLVDRDQPTLNEDHELAAKSALRERIARIREWCHASS